MNDWFWMAMGLSPALLVAVVAAGRGAPAERLVAVQLATSIGTAVLMSLSLALQQASSMDLALTLALLCLPATLVFALFEERWV